MNIVLNGEMALVTGPTLSDALVELGYEGKFATAVNETFVPVGARVAYQLKDGDRIEIVAPKQGG
ncbi:MAG: sulfur carrier protein ThiS [Pseudomonadota bacterium]